jgi:hypothetical protein
MAEINMRQYVLPVLESYGVDLVLRGHSHSYERSYFIDGHYGLSSTFSSTHQRDAGDGDPFGDGAHLKASLGPVPNSGAVYVMSGSGSEVRTATLNHPAMRVGLLELGSMVIDIQSTPAAGSALIVKLSRGYHTRPHRWRARGGAAPTATGLRPRAVVRLRRMKKAEF